MKMPPMKAGTDPLLRILLGRSMSLHSSSIPKGPKMHFGAVKTPTVAYKTGPNLKPVAVPKDDENESFPGER